MKSFSVVTISLLALMVGVAACGGGQEQKSSGGEAAQSGGLTPEQLANGIGPITSVSLGELDPELAEQGKATFELKCSACHKTDQRYVGPALGDVLSRRTPAYVMNMILNPEGMLSEHPEAKKLLAEFMTPMANQNLTEAEARSVVEYFRTLEMTTGGQVDEVIDSSGVESD